jgi:two-component system, cell cycle response regulator CpdR
VPPAPKVELHLSYKKSKDNGYKNNLSSSLIPQKEATRGDKNNTDKPLANLLLVYDDSGIAYALKQGLLKNRFLVTAFTSPEKALQNFQSNSEDYCLMLSDIRMPGISGIQLARKVKEINPKVKVVLMTSFEIKDNEFSKVFPSTQVDGFIQKPFRIKDLTNKILDTIGETQDE